MSPSIYTALPRHSFHVRTLRLLPAHSPDAPIECLLHVCSFEGDRLTSEEWGPDLQNLSSDGAEYQTYEALSYVWGDPTNPATITVNGLPLLVTRNLKNALQHLRTHDNMRHLWIDAICIDQTNLEERAHQVQRMLDIYQNADRVVVWLGVIQNRLPDDTRNFNNKKFHAALEEVLNQPWFERMWIIQEVQAAKRIIVQVGDLIYDSADFHDMMHGYLRKVGYSEKGREFLRPIISGLMRYDDADELNELNNLVQKTPLAGLVSLFAFCKATDPRDKIYALLGLSKDWKKTQGVKVDYTLTVDEVYERFTGYVFGNSVTYLKTEAADAICLKAKLFALGIIVGHDLVQTPPLSEKFTFSRTSPCISNPKPNMTLSLCKLCVHTDGDWYGPQSYVFDGDILACLPEENAVLILRRIRSSYFLVRPPVRHVYEAGKPNEVFSISRWSFDNSPHDSSSQTTEEIEICWPIQTSSHHKFISSSMNLKQSAWQMLSLDMRSSFGVVRQKGRLIGSYDPPQAW